jgi:uncharacterized membrane protein YidH (DUF202 family)
MSIKGALGLSATAEIFAALTSEGEAPVHVALNQHLPDGISLTVGLTAPGAVIQKNADQMRDEYFEHPVEDWLDPSVAGLSKAAALGLTEGAQSAGQSANLDGGAGPDEIDEMNESSGIQDVREMITDLSAPIREEEPLLRRLDADPATMPGGFQKQLLKFDRLSAHLANERTWLAWVRTTLSLLSIAFTLHTEMSSANHSGWRVALFVVGCATVLSVEVTYFTGWVRYQKVKKVLQTETSALQPKLGRFKLKLQTYSTFAVLVAIALAYWMGGYYSF